MSREIVFETTRLFACQWQIEDAQEAFGMYGNPAVMMHLGDSPAPNSESVEKRVQYLIDRNTLFPTGMGSYPVFEKGDPIARAAPVLDRSKMKTQGVDQAHDRK